MIVLLVLVCGCGGVLSVFVGILYCVCLFVCVCVFMCVERACVIAKCECACLCVSSLALRLSLLICSVFLCVFSVRIVCVCCLRVLCLLGSVYYLCESMFLRVRALVSFSSCVCVCS